jgi:hypothetical protein
MVTTADSVGFVNSALSSLGSSTLAAAAAAAAAALALCLLIQSERLAKPPLTPATIPITMPAIAPEESFFPFLRREEDDEDDEEDWSPESPLSPLPPPLPLNEGKVNVGVGMSRVTVGKVLVKSESMKLLELDRRSSVPVG